MELTAEQWRYVSLVVLVVLAIGSLLYATFIAAPRRRRLIEELAARELANIVEEVKPTPLVVCASR